MKNKGIAVVSVGNLVMGGAGKTPHTIAIAKEYLSRGIKTAVISLGYKGLAGYDINVLSDGKEFFFKPPMAADEPYMIGKNCPGAVIITGKRREEAIALARDKFGCSLAILDDGFQYRKAERDANILLLDNKSPFSTGFPFPFGYLREFPSASLRADIIVFTRAENEEIHEKAKKYTYDKPVFFSRPVTDKIVIDGKEIIKDVFRTKKIAAFSAVASNSSFQKALYASGLDVVYFQGFRDHALIKAEKIEDILKKGSEKGGEIFLTTEKDFVKLDEKYQKKFGYLKMEIDIKNRGDFFSAIDSLIK